MVLNGGKKQALPLPWQYVNECITLNLGHHCSSRNSAFHCQGTSHAVVFESLLAKTVQNPLVLHISSALSGLLLGTPGRTRQGQKPVYHPGAQSPKTNQTNHPEGGGDRSYSTVGRIGIDTQAKGWSIGWACALPSLTCLEQASVPLVWRSASKQASYMSLTTRGAAHPPPCWGILSRLAQPALDKKRVSNCNIITFCWQTTQHH